MADISNIRVTAAAEEFLTYLSDDQCLFKEDKAAARFAAAYAICHDLDIGLDENSPLDGVTFNKWDSQSVDCDGVFKLMIQARHPDCQNPYRMLQAIINKGLETMASKAIAGIPFQISSFLD